MLGFLEVTEFEVQNFPLVKRLDGSLFPVEVQALKAYDKQVSAEGLDIFLLARVIYETELVAGVEEKDPLSFNECLNLIFRPDTNPEVASKYAEEIKRVFNEQENEELRKIILATVFINTRASQSWLTANRKEIERKLLLLPYADYVPVIKNIPNLNHPTGEPLMIETPKRVFWTIEMTYRLAQSTIEEIIAKCTEKDVQKAEKDLKEKVDGNPDFLSQNSENV
jgi:hypothetical protein